MSHTVSIKRTISKSELMQAIDGDGEFSIMAEGNAFVVLRWSDGQESAVFNLVQGEINVGSPSENARRKMNRLAGVIGAEIIGEEDNLPVQSSGKQGASENRLWMGWPIIVITLIALLIWRW